MMRNLAFCWLWLVWSYTQKKASDPECQWLWIELDLSCKKSDNDEEGNQNGWVVYCKYVARYF